METNTTEILFKKRKKKQQEAGFHTGFLAWGGGGVAQGEHATGF